MWGLFALEEIPKGAFLLEMTGEVVTKKEAELTGNFYDMHGLSYLYLMNDPLEDSKAERDLNKDN